MLRAHRPGRGALLAKMAEAIFIETLRRYMEELPPEQTGWLAGARDPWSVRSLRSFTTSPVIRGRLPNWLPRPARRVPCWLNGSLGSWASRP
jgi:hypothetical protein